jgi:hypothetical protein
LCGRVIHLKCRRENGGLAGGVTDVKAGSTPEVKKKHVSFGWNFSCFAAHLIERDLF